MSYINKKVKKIFVAYISQERLKFLSTICKASQKMYDLMTRGRVCQHNIFQEGVLLFMPLSVAPGCSTVLNPLFTRYEVESAVMNFSIHLQS